MQSDSRRLLTTPGASSSSSSAAGNKPDRLYVGNLSPTVDEFTLLQVFSKYGKITKLDFMFHKTGVLKGKPRGFAFIEFSSKDDALKAMVKLHDRLLRGRKLVVTYSNSAPPTDLPPPTKGRRHTEAPKTTTLSLLKKQRRPQSAAAQIAAMEAKLAAMAKKKPADESYVPGLGIDSIYNAPRASTSASASPAPEDEDLDLALGLEEGARAAEDLEREFGVEIARHENDDPVPSSIKIEPEGSPAPAPGSSSPQPASAASVSGPSSLPRKPESSDKGPVNVKVETEDGAGKTEAFKRGLAGLPKKPVF